MTTQAGPPARTTGASREYQATQARLRAGWNTWDTRSVLTQAHLPSGLLIALGVKEYYWGWHLRHAQLGRRGEHVETVRLGPHAIDGSYTEVDLAWEGVDLRVRTAHDGDDVVILVEPRTVAPKPAVLTVEVAFGWGASGRTRVVDGGPADAAPAQACGGPARVEAQSDGFAASVFGTGTDASDPYADVDGPHLLLELSGPVVVATGRPRTVAEAQALVTGAAERLAAQTGGEMWEILRDTVAWNTLYEPAGNRVITQVSRLWNVQKRGGFAMFCWDTFFAALQADSFSADLAYANVIEMLREAVPDGFVPNVVQGTGRVTYDGSQPPFASLIALELYERHGEDWFLREVFPGLLTWNRWWWRARMRADLICAGSTPFTPQVPSPQDIPRIAQHFGATCEAGADDHPVFSDVPFDVESGLLQAHDIGLSAEYALDCEMLAQIAAILGLSAESAELDERGEAVRAAIRERLWDERSGIYRSHFFDAGPTALLSPMSFFAMLAAACTPEQTRRMVEEHLRNPAEFGGRWVIPVTPRNDPNSTKDSYWYGRVWPPINFLVFLGLARTGRLEDCAWLAQRSEELVLQEWREHRHAHENYSSETGAGCDVPNSEPLLAWGGLLALTVLLQRGEAPYFRRWLA